MATFVQAAQGTGISAVFAVPPTAGNLLVAVNVNNSFPATPLPIWNTVDTLNSIQDAVLCWRFARAGESTLISAFAPGPGGNVSVYEFATSGMWGWPANPIDVHAVTQGSSATPPTVTSASLTPTNGRTPNGMLAVFYSATNADVAPTLVAGMTIALTLSGGATGNGVGAYQLNVPTGVPIAPSATWSGTTASAACALVAVFYEGPPEVTLVQYAEALVNGGVTLPAPPTPGNLLVGCAWRASVPPTGSGWTLVQTQSVGAPFGILCGKIAGVGESTNQNPGTGAPQTFVMEFASASGWDPNVLVAMPWANNARAGATAPPSVATGTLTIGALNYFLGVACIANNKNNTPPVLSGMTLIYNLTGGAAIGNGTVAWQQPVVPTTSITCAWTGANSIASMVFVWTMAPAPYPRAFSGSVAGVGARGPRAIRSGVPFGSLPPTGIAARAITTGKVGPASIAPSGTIARASTRSLLGSLTPVGQFFALIAKLALGSIAPTGTTTKQTRRSLTGSSTPAGVIARAIPRTLAATIAPVGAALHAIGALLTTGSIAPAATVTKQTRRSSTGSLAPTGSLTTASVLLITLAGSIAPVTAALLRGLAVLRSGSLTPTGTTARQTAWSSTATVAPTGKLGRGVPWNLGIASIAPTATLGHAARLGRAFAATLAPAGTLARAIAVGKTWLSGSVAITTVMAMVTPKRLSISGSIAPTATLASHSVLNKTFAAVITLAGVMGVRSFFRPFAGVVRPQGATARRLPRILPGATISVAGAFAKRAGLPFLGRITPTGILGRTFTLMGLGSIAPTGSLGFGRTIRFFATLAPSATLRRAIAHRLSATLRPAAALARSIRHHWTASLTLADHAKVRFAMHTTRSGRIAPQGKLARNARAILAGVIAPRATVHRLIATTRAASITPTGAIKHLYGRAWAALLKPHGTMARAITRGLTGRIRPRGTIARLLNRALHAVIGPHAHLGIPTLEVPLSGAIRPTGTLRHARAVAFAGSIRLHSTFSWDPAMVWVARIKPHGTLTASVIRHGEVTLPVYGACSGLLVPTWPTNIFGADPVALLTTGLASSTYYDAEPVAVATTALVTV